MGGHIIEQTYTYKYLGILIDDKLNWKPQIDKMCSKLASVCGILSKVRHFLDRHSLIQIYYSLVESRLRYGILSWSTASDHQLNRLKVFQNRALRFIDFSPIGTYMLPLYYHYKILPLNDLIKLQRTTYMYCYQNNELPLTFSTYFSRPSHSHNTRYSKSNYTVPRHDSNFSAISMKILGPKIWAGVPDNAKVLPFRKTFSKHMKQTYINSLPRTRKTKLIQKKHENVSDYDDLRILFTSDEETEEFHGFCDSDLSALFNTTNEEQNDDFYGFFGSDLISIFENTTESEVDFLGFD